MARLSSELVLQLTDRVSKPARGVGSALDTLDRKVGRYRLGGADALGMTSLGPRMLAGAAAFAAPTAAAYAGAQAYREFADAERGLTRTGLKLGADRETMAAIRGEMGLIANKYAVPVERVVEAFDSLAESGFELADARAALDGIVQATQGLGGDGRDTVATFDAARKSIGLAQADAERFFDIIAAGGASGKFEGSDLARYLPSLLPVAARQGYQGLEGAARLVGFLEVMRDYVGSSEEAATATADIFEKISSPDVMKNFKKFGIDLEKRLGEARKNGEDVLVVLSDIIREATKGDATKLSELFGDRDSRRAANVLLTAIQRVKDAQDELRRNSGGTIRYNVDVVTQDAQAQLDKLNTSWTNFKQNVGAGIGRIATPALDALNESLDQSAAYDIGVKRYEQAGGSKAEARAEFNRRYDEAHPDDSWMTGGLQRRSQAFVRAMADYGRGQAKYLFEEVDRAIIMRASAERAKANGGRDPLVQGPNRPKPIDDAELRRGVPVPGSRESGPQMSEAEQRRLYGEGRRAAEETIRRSPSAYRSTPAKGLAASGPGMVVTEAGLEAQERRRQWDAARAASAPPPPPSADPGDAFDMPSEAYLNRKREILYGGPPPPTPAPVVSEPADRSGRVAPADLGRSTGTIPVPKPRPDLSELKRQGDDAVTAAEMAGQRISDAFSVTAKPKIDASSIDAADKVAARLEARLRSIATLQPQAMGALNNAIGRRMREYDREMSDFSGVHADLED